MGDIPLKKETSPVLEYPDYIRSALGDLGKNESKDDKYLSQCWQYTDLKTWKTVVGNDHAWCKAWLNWKLGANGYKYNNDAMAISGRDIGVKCDLQDFCIVVIRHSNGRHHINFCLKKLGPRKYQSVGGNQGNAVTDEVYDLDARGDTIVACRMPVKK